MNVSLHLEDPGTPESLAMLADGEAYGAALYPPESNHYLSVETLRSHNVRFVVVRDEHGHAVGTGAVVLHEDWAEIKRIWVVPASRGQGISKKLMADLEARAEAEGVFVTRLETGVDNDEAIILYERAGYVRRAPFAEYAVDPLSIFMEKRLAV